MRRNKEAFLVWVRIGPYLQLYPLPSRTGADLDNLARKFDADGLGGEDAPLVLDEAMEQTGSTAQDESLA